jgi:hypothetical protein
MKKMLFPIMAVAAPAGTEMTMVSDTDVLVTAGNKSSCIDRTIAEADSWMCEGSCGQWRESL